MEDIYRCCCGLDIHKKIIVACLITHEKKEGEKEVRKFGAMTKDLTELAAWLKEAGCEMCVMESTGVYWKPVFNVLECLDVPLMLANAYHIKQVPGRKTDVTDAEWIADLLCHGLINASFIPDRDQRELRDATRMRKNLTEDRTRALNRLDKLLESCNIKISSVLSSLSTVTGRNLVEALVLGDVTDANIDEMLKGSTIKKREELLVAVEGVLSSIQKNLINVVLQQIDYLSALITEIDLVIDKELANYQRAIERIKEMPGIETVSARTVLAEIGIDMNRFHSDKHLCNWAGVAPGNNESAGKRKNARTRPGNKILKSTLAQCAKTAIKSKDSYFKAQYDRLVPRLGKNRASMAVAHSMLIAIYHMLKDDVPFKDLGADYFTRYNKDRQVAYHIKKLTALGVDVLATT